MGKVVFVGDSGVGKTSIIQKYIKPDSFQLSLARISTVRAEFINKMIDFDGRTKIRAWIWDTAGQERFHSLVSSHYKNANGIIYVFDLTDESSFYSLRNWIDQAINYSLEDCRGLVIGNKKDLADNGLRKVKKKQARRFAYTNQCDYYETSAKDGENIEKAIDSFAKCKPNEMGFHKGVSKEQIS